MTDEPSNPTDQRSELSQGTEAAPGVGQAAAPPTPTATGEMPTEVDRAVELETSVTAAETPAVEPVAEQPPAEEPTETVPAEPEPEAEPEAAVAEPAAAAETPAVEPVAEQPPAEEPTETVPAEPEPEAEPQAAVAEPAAVAETPAVEPVAEQPPAEEPTETAAAEPEAPAEPQAAVAEPVIPAETPAVEPVAEQPPAEEPTEAVPVEPETPAEPEAAIAEPVIPAETPAVEPVAERSPRKKPRKTAPAEAKADEDQQAEEPAAEPKSEEMNWYILKVQSNREDSIREGLLRRVKVVGLEYFFGDVIVPTEMITEFKGGKKRIVKRKLYPGYLVVHMEINDDTWFLVRETPGIGDFTGAAGHPTPMLPHEVARIVAKQEEKSDETPKLKISFHAGDRVKINEGTFENFEGEVDALDETSGRVTVMINIFGRSTPVELEYWQIESI